jgi:hypothetical protein
LFRKQLIWQNGYDIISIFTGDDAGTDVIKITHEMDVKMYYKQEPQDNTH